MNNEFKLTLEGFINSTIVEANYQFVRKYNLGPDTIKHIPPTNYYDIEYMFDEVGEEMIASFDRISYNDGDIKLYITDTEDDYVELRWFTVTQLVELLDELL